MNPARLLLWTSTAVAGAAALALGGGAWRWARTVVEAENDLAARTQAPLRADREAMPGVVRRYLDRAVPPGTSAVGRVEIQQTGTFQMGEGEEGWRPFTAREVFRVDPPGFFWDARIEMAPFVTVRVLDSYTADRATMIGRVLGVLPVVSQVGGESLARGALARYLAEAVWFPSRLEDARGLQWREVDRCRAEARLTDGEIEVSLTFTFDDQADVITVEGVRPREVDGLFVDTEWVGRFSDHEDVGGFRIPMYGEVAWVIDGVAETYWRGTLTDVRFVPLDQFVTNPAG